MKFILHTYITKKELNENVKTMLKKNWKISDVQLLADIPPGMNKKTFMEKFENEKFDVDFIIDDGDPKDLKSLHL